MKKMVGLLSILLSLGTGAMAAAAAADSIVEKFTDATGNTRTLRLVRDADFENELVSKGLSPALIENRKERLHNNHAGVFIVGSEEGDVLGRLMTGAMPLGYQPWPAVTDDDKARSNDILSFYQALLTAVELDIAPTKKHREGADIDLLHINPKALALTVVLGGDFGTISAQEAAVKLVRKLGMGVVRDPGVTEAGVPQLCVSLTQKEGFASTAMTRVYSGLPYYPGADGLRYVAVTALKDGVVFPEEYPHSPFDGFADLEIA